jgi:hypothetical protein
MTAEDEVMHLMTDPKIQMLHYLKHMGLKEITCTINTDRVFQAEAMSGYSPFGLPGLNLTHKVSSVRSKTYPHFQRQDITWGRETPDGFPVTIRFTP